MWVDILTGTIFIIAVLQGYRKGFIRAVISFFSLFVGLILAFKLAGLVAEQLKQHTKIASYWLPFISFLVVLILVLLILKWVAGLLQQSTEWLSLGWLNKLLGILLYGIIYFTIWSAVFYFLQLLGVIEGPTMVKNYSYSYLQKWWPFCMEKLATWLPFIKSTIATFSSTIK